MGWNFRARTLGAARQMFSADHEWFSHNNELTAEALNDALSDIQENLTARTSLTLDRVEILAETHAVSELDAESVPSSRHPPDELNLSFVSAHIQGPQRKVSYEAGVDGKRTRITTLIPGKEITFHSAEDGKRLLMRPVNKYADSEWRSRRISEIEKIVDADTDIVCFPEFSFPMPDYRKAKNSRERGKQSTNAIDAMTECLDLHLKVESNKHNDKIVSPFILMGSFHCPLDYYNTAVIYPQGTNQKSLVGRVYERSVGEGKPRPKTTKFDVPIFYNKKFPSRRLGESARVPAGVEFNTFRSRGFQISVLICSDIVDLNQFLNIHRLNSNHKRQGSDLIDIILVPAYNWSDILPAMCQELSLVSRTIVIYNNANPYWNNFPYSRVYCCGQEIFSIFEDSSDDAQQPTLRKTPQKSSVGVEVITNKRVGQGVVTKLRINMNDFRAIRRVYRDFLTEQSSDESAKQESKRLSEIRRYRRSKD